MLRELAWPQQLAHQNWQIITHRSINKKAKNMEGLDTTIMIVIGRLIKLQSICLELKSLIQSTNKQLRFCLLRRLTQLVHHWRWRQGKTAREKAIQESCSEKRSTTTSTYPNIRTTRMRSAEHRAMESSHRRHLRWRTNRYDGSVSNLIDIYWSKLIKLDFANIRPDFH
jgi:hypothetical protein